MTNKKLIPTTKFETIKTTSKALLLKTGEVEFWVQKRWYRADGTLTKKGEEALELAKKNFNPTEKKERKTLYYSVRLAEAKIVGRAHLLTAFDGSSCFVPSVAIGAIDCEVTKSDALWVAAWALKNKTLQYSTKKQIWK